MFKSQLSQKLWLLISLSPRVPRLELVRQNLWFSHPGPAASYLYDVGMLCSCSECQCCHLKNKMAFRISPGGLLLGFRDSGYDVPGTEGNQYVRHLSLLLRTM